MKRPRRSAVFSVEGSEDRVPTVGNTDVESNVLGHYSSTFKEPL